LEKETLPAEMLSQIENDSRTSVARLLAKWRLAQQKKQNETVRLHKLFEYERGFYDQGYSMIAGIDEAGRGPLAGPVTVGCVILPVNCHIPFLNDSKKLSCRQREELYHLITEVAIAYSCAIIPVDVIDTLNIYRATQYGMYQAIKELSHPPDAVLIDAVPLPELSVPSKSIIGGDAASGSIAAASIIAKVQRDHIMDQLDEQYPAYGFKKHKGYPTPEHLNAIHKCGPCCLHRRSFEPVKSWRLHDGNR
jgi:ribonuclease HII